MIEEGIRLWTAIALDMREKSFRTFGEWHTYMAADR